MNNSAYKKIIILESVLEIGKLQLFLMTGRQSVPSVSPGMHTLASTHHGSVLPLCIHRRVRI